MPPLEAKPFNGTPVSEKEKELRRKESKMRLQLYAEMQGIMPKPRRSIFSNQFEQIFSPKAVYKVEGQSEQEFTRAWLQKSRGYGEIALVTDRAIIADNTAVTIHDSQVVHFKLGSTGIMYTDYYLGGTTEQTIELFEAAAETIALIRQASLTEALGQAAVAA